VLGVGPTARAALAHLKSHGANVSLWNRTRERAEAAAERFDVGLWNGSPVDVVFSTLPPKAEIAEAVADVVRNASIVIDANYGPRTTLADRLDRSVIDGLGMLRHSALASFRLFSIPRQERIAEAEHDVSPWLTP
jgi:shikimate 5-dehydrogenase